MLLVLDYTERPCICMLICPNWRTNRLNAANTDNYVYMYTGKLKFKGRVGIAIIPSSYQLKTA